MPSTSAVAILLTTLASQGAQERVDYNRDIRPILAQNCFACHGFDGSTRKAGLRLDRADFAYATNDGVTPIVPGDPAASEVWKRITAADPDDLMPPPSSHRMLDDAQKELIRAWIEQGAPYAEHWAFVAPVKPAVPGNAPSPIDAFIDARLVVDGRTRAPEAARAELMRRVTLDLTGLPPSAEEVAAFVADRRADAYERLVDRLLSSPHYGERMALPWLDAARYADTNGFSIDGGRHMWLWRDWVIHAFNTNKPYDRFLVEQLAGDLLPGRDDATLTATGFQRNAMNTHEGGTIAEENLVTYGADRVRTYGEAVLGLTLGCAQCHDHKFDPITQREYYSLFAYFNQTTEAAYGGDGGVNASPVASVRSVLVTGEEDALRARIAALEAQLASIDREAFEAWELGAERALARRGLGFATHPVRLTGMSTPNTGSGFSIEDGRFARVERPMSFLAFDVAMEFEQPSRPVTGLRITMHEDPAAPGAGWGWSAAEGGKHTFAVTNVSVSAGTVASPQVNLYRMLGLQGATANCWSEGNHPRGVLDTRGDHAWMPDLAHEGPVHLTVIFDEPLAADATHLTAQINFGRWGNVAARRMEFALVSGVDDGTELPPAVVRALGVAREARSDAERALLDDYYRMHAPATERTRIDLANTRERLAARTEAFPTMVMDTAPAPRETFVLERGNYAAPRDRVEAGVPAVLPPLPEGAPANRLALAEWSVDPRNPLTARVAVNRAWQMMFGTGLVRTASDFGLQGEWPSHPELLDWLACDFMEHGWDLKRLVRMIALSATYRQDSRATADALAQDPANRLLARGPRMRLPAEFIRDAALKAGGLLVDEIGGPSVNPYTPGDPWREVSHYGSSPATAQSFHQDRGAKLYRRSIYTYWKRTLPPPAMAILDAPNRETCTFERANTNTPLQALVLLNDEQFVEAARAFGERIAMRAGDDAARIVWAFTEATSRTPKPEEAAVLARALVRERERFRAAPAAAERAIAHGESEPVAHVDPAELAAWSQVATVLLNLSETVTRN
jgi:mono/diheme cytochrome c family protein